MLTDILVEFLEVEFKFGDFLDNFFVVVKEVDLLSLRWQYCQSKLEAEH